MKIEDLENLSLDELIKLSNKPFKCDNLDCCDYEKYDQCFNHSHSICSHYEAFFQSREWRYKNE